MIVGSVAIFILAFIYTAFVVDPEHAADSLQKYGGVIPGIEPGEPTAEHLDRIVSYTTCVGAVYLAAIFADTRGCCSAIAQCRFIWMAVRC